MNNCSPRPTGSADPDNPRQVRQRLARYGLVTSARDAAEIAAILAERHVLAGAAERFDGERSGHGWRGASSGTMELERCRHGFTAGEFCDECDAAG